MRLSRHTHVCMTRMHAWQRAAPRIRYSAWRNCKANFCSPGLQKQHGPLQAVTTFVALQCELGGYLKRKESSNEACSKPLPPFRPRLSCLRFETRPADDPAIPLAVCH